MMSENIAKAVLCAMWEVQTCARRDKVPGPLRDFGKMANCIFETWLAHHSTLQMFASKVLSGSTDLRTVTGQLPRDTAEACWRFVTLLERIRDGQLG